MKIFSIVGARPQFIKLAVIHRAFLNKKKFVHEIIHTGQHYDSELSQIFFEELDIPKPHYQLDISDSLTSTVEKMEEKIETVLAKDRPSLIIVYGDTNSTLAGALAAKKFKIALAHIEAGLRSNNPLMPEELNRIETDKISDLLFCPTNNAVNNLKPHVNKSSQKIILSGDIMLDSYNFYGNRLEDNVDTKVNTSDFILCTLHRESLMESSFKMKEVIKALNYINAKIPLKLPAHPRLKKMLNDLNLNIDFTITEPVGYLEMRSLLNKSKMVITDSGGLQKEAYFSKKICITLRNETEWTELTDAGVNFLAGDSSSQKIIETFNTAVNATGDFNEIFYGTGNASAIIVEEIDRYLQKH